MGFYECGFEFLGALSSTFSLFISFFLSSFLTFFLSFLFYFIVFSPFYPILFPLYSCSGGQHVFCLPPFPDLCGKTGLWCHLLYPHYFCVQIDHKRVYKFCVKNFCGMLTITNMKMVQDLGYLMAVYRAFQDESAMLQRNVP
jgi:hypothetical protein